MWSPIFNLYQTFFVLIAKIGFAKNGAGKSSIFLISIILLVSCASSAPSRQSLDDIYFPRLKSFDLPEGHIRLSYATGSEGRLILGKDGCIYLSKKNRDYLVLWPEEMILKDELGKIIASHSENDPEFQDVVIGEKVYLGGAKTHLAEGSAKRLPLYTFINNTPESLRAKCNTDGFFPIKSSNPAT